MLKLYVSSTKNVRISWSSGRLAEGCEKVRVQLNKTVAKMCDDPGEKKCEIFVPRRTCLTIFSFLFFSARSTLGVEQNQKQRLPVNSGTY